MITHYFKIALRNLFQNNIYSLINIFGLTVGMGVCLLIYQYIHFEMSYDKFHSNAQNTYRLIHTTIMNGEEKPGTSVLSSFTTGVLGQEGVPEIKQYVRVHPQLLSRFVVNPETNKQFEEDKMMFVDSNFLKIFNFPLNLGEKESVLGEKYNIVITEQTATKYFGVNNPIGKTLRVSGGIGEGDFTVTGVLKDLPINSHLQFDFIMPMKIVLEHEQYAGDLGWGWSNFVTYVTLKEAVNLEKVGEKLDHIITTSYVGEAMASYNIESRTRFQPIVDVHLKSDHAGDPSTNNGDIQQMRVFSIIAVFILIIAWSNFVNLSTARAMYRAKEVGIRKSIGAFKTQLIFQFMIESSLINILSAILSLGIAFLALPVLNNVIGKELELSVLQNMEFWIWFLMIIIFGSLLSGIYPAFILSSFKPVSMLHAVKITQKGGFNMRRGLIVVQFLTSAIIISGTYLVYTQITFMKSQNLGINMEEILVLRGPNIDINGENLKSKLQTFKNKLSSHHSISAVGASGSVPSKGFDFGTSLIRKLGAPETSNQSGKIISVDFGFLNTYNFQLLAGRFFSEEMKTDEKGVIINEESVRVYGLGSPENALNEKLFIQDDTLNILGVVKNFHWSSLRDAHSPYIFALWEENSAYFSIMLNLSEIPKSLSHIESTYNLVFPNNPFDYFFLDDEFNRQYQSELQFGNLFTIFSILAIFISCLGLFALVSFSANMKNKEIGIRKVLGANISQLMILLSREYIILLLTANILAIPIIIYGERSWLDNYAFKAGIGIELFLIPGLILIIFSLLTVSYRTYTAASVNPVKSLKT